MEHIAIMKKEWGLIPQILAGQKSVESRRYKSKIAPYGKIAPGDIIYFKDSGCPITVVAQVTKAEQYEIQNNEQAIQLMQRYANNDLGTNKIPIEVLNYITNKKYAVFVHFSDAKEIEPFNIDKRGFGMQCAWITLHSVLNVKL